jgi:hypothetical protein
MNIKYSVKYSDKQRYEDNLIFNTKYLIRDVWTMEQLLELQELIEDIIEDKLEGGYNE